MMRIFLFLFVIFSFSPAIAFETKAKQAYIIDFETGQSLLSKNADQKMPTSSMSKVMTTYMVFDAIKNGNLSMDTTFTISEKASKKGGSKMFIAEGSEVSVEDLVKGIVIQSGNDATIAVAEGISGDEETFSRAMTKRAKEMGMENSNFVNASGWPDENHYSTAEDLALLATRLIKDFPNHYSLYSETEFTYSDITQKNRNPLLYSNLDVDGIKTGHTEAAGYGLIGSATKRDRRVIMVINGLESEVDRVSESKRLMTWALSNFKNRKAVEKGQLVGQAPVTYGQEESVNLTATEDLLVTIKSSDKPRYKLSYKSPLNAPLKAGQEVGTLQVSIRNLEEPIEVPVVAQSSVEKAGLIDRSLMKLQHLIKGTF